MSSKNIFFKKTFYTLVLVTIFFKSYSDPKTVTDDTDFNRFFVTASGGWGHLSSSPHNTGVFTTTAGYFFNKNITGEFRYLGYFASKQDTELNGNSYLGLVKYNYELFSGVRAGAGVGLGIGSSFQKNKLLGLSSSKASGLFAVPVSLSVPTGFIDNMDFLITYLYVKSFDKGEANFITTGLSYSF
ncbi:hypothetical protein [Francisella salina]|uniref:Outer membrane protein beta-barrel domain-containing protein n=1 Tax=Francisella salina TaxID=573569 RepID=A0ABN3ZML7_FRAST|nr:hypothetical protein [Francisella salina]AEI36077.1 hypothetical protein F7308_1151 [Francisella salina]